MLQKFKTIYTLILPELRISFYKIVFWSILVSFIEMLGISSIGPFISILLDPSRLDKNNGLLKIIMTVLNIDEVPSIHFLGFLTISILVISNISAIILAWKSILFTSELSVKLAERLALSHFRHEFKYFLDNSPSALANQLCEQVSSFGSAGALQLCYAIARISQIIIITSVLIVTSPIFSFILIIFLSMFYYIAYSYSVNRIKECGRVVVESGEAAQQAASEMYENARLILLRGGPGIFLERITNQLNQVYQSEAISRFLPSLPKYAVEILASVLVFMLPIYRSMTGGDVRSDIPVIATFAYAGLRMLPSVQQLYSSYSIINYYNPAARKLIDILSYRAVESIREDNPDNLETMPGELLFKNVSYNYVRGSEAAVKDITFSILRGEKVAIVGKSGSGKSTLIDLLTGLLTASKGSILVNGKIHANRLNWSNGIIGYVPQKPALINASVAENIAFGEDIDKISLQRCHDSARSANILNLIDSLPQKFDTLLGYEQIHLSGGELQRLAIARALYTDPDILILDEPASSLDPIATSSLFELITGSNILATTIVVTHDISHISKFDKVFFMEKGKIIMEGTEKSLLDSCEEFRAFSNNISQRD